MHSSHSTGHIHKNLVRKHSSGLERFINLWCTTFTQKHNGFLQAMDDYAVWCMKDLRFHTVSVRKRLCQSMDLDKFGKTCLLVTENGITPIFLVGHVTKIHITVLPPFIKNGDFSKIFRRSEGHGPKIFLGLPPRTPPPWSYSHFAFPCLSQFFVWNHPWDGISPYCAPVNFQIKVWPPPLSWSCRKPCLEGLGRWGNPDS